MTARDNAARILRQINSQFHEVSPWNRCVIAATKVTRNSPEYIHIREVAIKFRPTQSVVIQHYLNQ